MRDDLRSGCRTAAAVLLAPAIGFIGGVQLYNKRPSDALELILGVGSVLVGLPAIYLFVGAVIWPLMAFLRRKNQLRYLWVSALILAVLLAGLGAAPYVGRVALSWGLMGLLATGCFWLIAYAGEP